MNKQRIDVILETAIKTLNKANSFKYKKVVYTVNHNFEVVRYTNFDDVPVGSRFIICCLENWHPKHNSQFGGYINTDIIAYTTAYGLKCNAITIGDVQLNGIVFSDVPKVNDFVIKINNEELVYDIINYQFISRFAHELTLQDLIDYVRYVSVNCNNIQEAKLCLMYLMKCSELRQKPYQDNISS